MKTFYGGLSITFTCCSRAYESLRYCLYLRSGSSDSEPKHAILILRDSRKTDSKIKALLYGAPNGSKIVFWKGRYFFRDRDTSCGKGDTSSEIEILLVESQILFKKSRYFYGDRRYFFGDRDASRRDTFSCHGILYVCRGKLLSYCRSFAVCIVAAFVA